MIRFSFYSRLLMTLLCLIGVIGCDKRPADLPRLTPCQLMFQYEDGSPVDDAVVMQYPVDGKWYSNGKTDSSGQAKMFVNGEFSGAVPGEYKVTIKKTEVILPPGFDPDGDNEGLPDAVTISHVDEKFGSLNTTPLTLVVAKTPVNETFTVQKPKPVSSSQRQKR